MEKELVEAFRLLGIPVGSDQSRVGHAYRRLARATHPDVSADPDAAQRFADVVAAYRLASTVAPPRGSGPAGPESDPVRGKPAESGPQHVVSPHLAAGRAPRPIFVAGPVVISPLTSELGTGEA